MASPRSKVLSLYRNLLRESKKFDSYSYRRYALVKVKYEFRENRNVTDAGKLNQLLKKAEDSLQMIKRQNILFIKEKDRSALNQHSVGRVIVNFTLSPESFSYHFKFGNCGSAIRRGASSDRA